MDLGYFSHFWCLILVGHLLGPFFGGRTSFYPKSPLCRVVFFLNLGIQFKGRNRCRTQEYKPPRDEVTLVIRLGFISSAAGVTEPFSIIDSPMVTICKRGILMGLWERGKVEKSQEKSEVKTERDVSFGCRL